MVYLSVSVNGLNKVYYNRITCFTFMVLHLSFIAITQHGVVTVGYVKHE